MVHVGLPHVVDRHDLLEVAFDVCNVTPPGPVRCQGLPGHHILLMYEQKIQFVGGAGQYRELVTWTSLFARTRSSL
jgi:hypothetical protein